jgi:hypothetical protein
LHSKAINPDRRALLIHVFDPVDNVVVAVAVGGGAHGLQVGPAGGLGQRHRRAQLPGGHAGKVGGLLFLSSEGAQ